MGSTYFTNPIAFILTTIFDLYIAAVAIRFLLQWVRADFYNPVSQFLVKITNPLLVPLRRVLPGIGGIDIASIVLMLLLAAIEISIINLLSGATPTAIYLVMLSIAKIVELFLTIFIFSIIIQVILSWINPHNYNPVSMLLYQLNQPLLRPFRRLLPDMGGFDLSPIFAILMLQVSKMILLPPLYQLANAG